MDIEEVCWEEVMDPIREEAMIAELERRHRNRHEDILSEDLQKLAREYLKELGCEPLPQ